MRRHNGTWSQRTTPRMRRERRIGMKMHNAPKNQPHTSYPANRLRNCSHRGFHDFAARPRWPSHTATRAAQPQGGGGKPCRSSWVTPSAPRTTSAQPSGTGVAYVLFTPEATLFSDDGGQIITHFFSPNPDPDPNTNPTVVADGAIRATWQHSGHEHRLGQGAPTQWHPAAHRRPECDCLAPARRGWNPKTDRPVATR